MLNGFEADRFACNVETTAAQYLAPPSQRDYIKAALFVNTLAEEEYQARVSDDGMIDCQAGCAHCCIVNVAVLRPEADAIAAWLIEHRSPQEVDTLRSRLITLEKETRWLDDEERMMVRKSCAFLDQEGRCDIYPVRPLLCRALNSTSSDDCREAVAMLALDEQRPIVSNLLQKEIFESAFRGFGEALKQNGVDHRSHRLTSAVRERLERFRPNPQEEK